MNEPIVTVIGNVATEVKLAVTQHGTSLTSFRLASTARRLDRSTGRWVDGDTSFFRVTCWRALAENAASSLAKGDPVVVLGRLRVRPWERDERSGLMVEIDAISVGHDLMRGQSSFRKVKRERPDETSDRQSAEDLVVAMEAEDDFQATRDGGPGRAYEPVVAGTEEAA